MSAHIYVVEFDQGTIKVGQTSQPENRMRSLMLQGQKFNIGTIRHWCSEEHMGAFLNEKTLIRWCAERAKSVHGEEWFMGLQFEEVKAAAIYIIATDGLPPVA